MEEKQIILGGGCFWCTEAVFQRVDGVLAVLPGYAGGDTPNPTYEDVSTGKTGHAEVVEVVYDPEVVSLKRLLDIFFRAHDPTSLNRQGNDIGTQYRSVIYYVDDEDLHKIEEIMEDFQIKLHDDIVTEVKKIDIQDFYEAEHYHHDYYNQNSATPYCQMVIDPKLLKLKQFLNDESI